MQKVSSFVASGKSQGARVAYGGEPGDGLVFKPTVFADVASDMESLQEEFFWPGRGSDPRGK